jgi:hypothetical protein
MRSFPRHINSLSPSGSTARLLGILGVALGTVNRRSSQRRKAVYSKVRPIIAAFATIGTDAPVGSVWERR